MNLRHRDWLTANRMTQLSCLNETCFGNIFYCASLRTDESLPLIDCLVDEMSIFLARSYTLSHTETNNSPGILHYSERSIVLRSGRRSADETRYKANLYTFMLNAGVVSIQRYHFRSAWIQRIDRENRTAVDHEKITTTFYDDGLSQLCEPRCIYFRVYHKLITAIRRASGRRIRWSRAIIATIGETTTLVATKTEFSPSDPPRDSDLVGPLKFGVVGAGSPRDIRRSVRSRCVAKFQARWWHCPSGTRIKKPRTLFRIWEKSAMATKTDEETVAHNFMLKSSRCRSAYFFQRLRHTAQNCMVVSATRTISDDSHKRS